MDSDLCEGNDGADYLDILIIPKRVDVDIHVNKQGTTNCVFTALSMFMILNVFLLARRKKNNTRPSLHKLFDAKNHFN